MSRFRIAVAAVALSLVCFSSHGAETEKKARAYAEGIAQKLGVVGLLAGRSRSCRRCRLGPLSTRPPCCPYRRCRPH